MLTVIAMWADAKYDADFGPVYFFTFVLDIVLLKVLNNIFT